MIKKGEVFFEVITPGFAADGRAFNEAMCGVGFGVRTGPLALALLAHGLTPPLATGFVCACGNDR